MIITELIREQAIQCAVMAGAGVFIMVMYQLFRYICGIPALSAAVAAAAEIIFWIAAAFITSRFLYYCAYGRPSFHSAVAFVTGALLWKKFFYGIIDKIYSSICKKQGICIKHGEKEKKQPIQGHQPGDRH